MRTRKRGPENGCFDLVVAEDVADVLAEEALDALPELLDPLDVLLLPAPVSLGLSVGGENGGIGLLTS